MLLAMAAGFAVHRTVSAGGQEVLQMVNGDGEVLAEKAVTTDAVQETAARAGEGGSAANQYCLSGKDHFQAYKEMFGEENVEWVTRDSLSSADRLRIQNWGDNAPSEAMYIKYKDIYQDNLYFNQSTGEINWPNDNGFLGKPIDTTLKVGSKIDRYGSDFGTFTSPMRIPYEQRSLAPGTELKPYSVFEVLKPIDVKAGKIAPWFNQPGGGMQYIMPDTIDQLIEDGFLRRIN